MGFSYYFRGNNDEDEVIIQMTGNKDKPLSIRVTEADDVNGNTTAMINLPIEEINSIINCLQRIRQFNTRVCLLDIE